jgi:UDP-glucose 4-epimerase
MKNILITGGFGYIGSHTVVELLQENYNVIIIDNLCNSKMNVSIKIKHITKNDTFKTYIGDILDYELLDKIFLNENIDAVIHFAGLKAVGESVSNPIKYYENNVSGTVHLLKVMEKYNVKNLIFSSSATVYGNNKPPFTESNITGLNITNPYGRSKYLIEEILKDLKDWNIFCLRYFNPIGSHKSGIMGDDPNGIPNNLMPYILRVANKQYTHLNIYGNDYNTIDGTGVRDYIHVVDLAKAHVKALDKFSKGFNIVNLGTGKGTSVLELIHIFEKVNNVKIPYIVCNRRDGDIDVCYCDTTKSKEILDWTAELTIEDMCKDSWNFIKTIHL